MLSLQGRLTASPSAETGSPLGGFLSEGKQDSKTVDHGLPDCVSARILDLSRAGWLYIHFEWLVRRTCDCLEMCSSGIKLCHKRLERM